MTYKLSHSKIIIRDLRLHAYHGVLPQERIVGQDYTINISAEYDISRAAETDDLTHAVNYASVCNIVVEEMKEPSKLLENVAMRIAKRVINEFKEIRQIDIQIMKNNPPIGFDCESTGVQVCLINDKTL